tara:strand:- start:3977 stop:4162 length:186 start_codon:yes stop_codon:yes gene_type:complete
MTFKIVDLRTNKLLGIYETADQAVKAESRMMHVPGETWYAIEAPVEKKTKTRKARVKKESD